MAKFQGRFTSTGVNYVIDVPIQIDRMHIINETQYNATGVNTAIEFDWQRGMADQAGVYKFKNASNALLGEMNDATNPGFSLVNSADQNVGVAVAVTAVSNATQFVSSTASTSGLATGDIVRLTNIATQTNTRGFDFEIDTVVANTSFAARWALASVPGGAGGAGFYRKVDFEPIFYPRNRFVVNISQATQGVVTTSVAHGYQVGQKVVFYFPVGQTDGTNAFGMEELNNVEATIVAVSTANNTFTINVDTSTFTAFAWPDPISDFCTVAPAGMDTAQALSSNVNENSDARENQAIRGMVLYAGALSPAGINNDVIYWEAESADNVSNL